ncbi:MAG: hypothetical protein EA377_12365, partial [Phycisphaerales bacterium]
GGSDEVGYLGIDPQPFLLEAFVGHLYKGYEIPEFWIDPDPDDPDDDPIPYVDVDGNPEVGQYVVLDQSLVDGADDPHRTAIVVVQIANPFDVPIDLWDYEITVFGQTYRLGPDFNAPGTENLPEDARFLAPARNDRPTTAIFYAMRNEIGSVSEGTDDIHPGTYTAVDDTDPLIPNNDADYWLSFLDLNPQPSDVNILPDNRTRIVQDGVSLLPAGTIIHRVGVPGVDEPWAVSQRDPYDLYDPTDTGQSGAIRLERITNLETGQTIVVDRIDAQQSPPDELTFGEAVRSMAASRPGPRFPDAGDELGTTEEEEPAYNDPGAPGEGGPYPEGYKIGADHNHWVQWVRYTRAWGVDTNLNGLYESHERNPRFVFADGAISYALEAATPDDSYVEPLKLDEEFEQGDQDFDEIFANIGDRLGANRYNFDDPPNGDTHLPSPTIGPWFSRAYYSMADAQIRHMNLDPSQPDGGDIGLGPARKPTFFALGWQEGQWANVPPDERQFFMPDKGWYGQYRVPNIDAGTPEIDPTTVQLGGIGSVDDPPFLLSGIPYRFILDDGTPVDAQWNGPATPIVRHPQPLQMTMKNKIIPEDWPVAAPLNALDRFQDFEQVGELLNVWLFGHELAFPTWPIQPGEPVQTRVTFSEFMSGRAIDPADTLNEEARLWELTGAARDFTTDVSLQDIDLEPYDEYREALRDGYYRSVNRLRTRPVPVVDSDGRTVRIGSVVGDVTASGFIATIDPRQALPALPAGARLLDAFVCDGPGWFANPNPAVVGITIAPGWTYGGAIDAVGPAIFGTDYGSGNPEWRRRAAERLSYYNANEFDGRITPGLININTATPEVMRAMPHMTRMVSEDPDWSLSDNPFVRVADSIVRYRERLGNPVLLPTTPAAFNSFNNNPQLSRYDRADRRPAYAHRGWALFDVNGDPIFEYPHPQSELEPLRPFVDGIRGERGFASVGELTLLTQSGRSAKEYISEVGDDRYVVFDPTFDDLDGNASFRIDYGAMPERVKWNVDQDIDTTDPSSNFAYLFPENITLNGVDHTTSRSAWISTDTKDVYAPGENFANFPPNLDRDNVAEDQDEANLLFAGISNLVSTRSDVFIVYFRIRSFRQNDITGVWDATDPDFIVDDSRYVMVVDRSEVNTPDDEPKILLLEKLPY